MEALADHPEDIYCAMVLSLRDYVNKNGFKDVVLGLSGGIDSAICAALGVDAPVSKHRLRHGQDQHRTGGHAHVARLVEVVRRVEVRQRRVRGAVAMPDARHG